ncbi:MAG: C1 family peptidase [Bacteroidaceae bacterium]|nr:C1 family peptidase [Bacteroidaceae bacterium]
MRRKYQVLATVFCAFCLQAQAQLPTNPTTGGISPKMLQTIKKGYKGTTSDIAIGNAIRNVDIRTLATVRDNRATLDDNFSNRVNSKGLTNQYSSGRCWLFTGLNVFRAQAIARFNMGDFQFSQTYPFFFDQLEKSNLFLQGIIDTREKPMDDKMVEWLFKHPLSDGGQFTGVSDLLSKYGIVPADVMRETYSTKNTSRIARLIALKLKENALDLRQMAQKGAAMSELLAQKTTMLSTIYRMLVLGFGEPPTEFTWTQKDASGKPVSTETYTPLSFYKKYIHDDLQQNYVMLMNDPTRAYNKLYEIDYDRHVYDGHNWTYVNLPIEEIKEMAIASIKDSTMMYLSCDVGKSFQREDGTLDLGNFDYSSLMNTTFGMDKKERIATFASGSSHAMTLMAVDIAKDGKTTKWMVENSWGAGPHDGHLILTDQWFNEYLFRLVVQKKYITKKVAKILKQKPIRLPAWDPMFAEED